MLYIKREDRSEMGSYLKKGKNVNASGASFTNGELSMPKFPNEHFLHFISNNFQKSYY